MATRIASAQRQEKCPFRKGLQNAGDDMSMNEKGQEWQLACCLLSVIPDRRIACCGYDHVPGTCDPTTQAMATRLAAANSCMSPCLGALSNREGSRRGAPRAIRLRYQGTVLADRQNLQVKQWKRIKRAWFGVRSPLPLCRAIPMCLAGVCVFPLRVAREFLSFHVFE